MHCLMVCLANVLSGIWRLKGKIYEFQCITKYIAQCVGGGNHQIQGINFDLPHPLVGLTNTLQTNSLRDGRCR